MDREPVAIPGEISVERALDEYFLRYRWPWFPVVGDAHRFLGLVLRDCADEVPEVSRSTALIADLIASGDDAYQIPEDAPLDRLLGNQNLRRFGALMAVDADGRLAGVITVEQVGRALRDGATGWRRISSVRHAIQANGEIPAGLGDLRAVALDDAAEVRAGGEGAEGVAPVAAEAGGAEGVGDGLVAVADQQRGLEGDRHPLDHAAGALLDRLDVAGDLLAQRRRRRRRGGARRPRPRAPRRRRPRPRPGS